MNTAVTPPTANPSVTDDWQSYQHDRRRARSNNDRTSRTDDERIKDITVLPPPEHLIRFFPIRGTRIETLITQTRHHIQDIMAGTDDRLLVVMGPCSIHYPAAALEYARQLKV